MIIKAPYPIFKTALVLPDPQLGDSVALVRNLHKQFTMNGTMRTYVQTTDQKRYVWSVEMTRAKSLLLLELFRDYGGYQWEITFGSNTFIGMLNADTIELADFVRDGSIERLTTALEFIG